MSIFRRGLLGLAVVCAMGLAPIIGAAAEPEAVQAVDATETAETPTFAEVRWTGPGVSLDALKGKTVLMLSYVTWCPICNEWSPTMLQQVRDAIRDKPVVVVAIATDKPDGPVYMAQRKFGGPNIFHGYDPNINVTFGLQKANLLNYAVVDPTGKVIKKGAAGSYYEGPPKEYAIARELASVADQGSFMIISPKQSPGVQQALWPLELGYPVTDAILSKAKGKLDPQDDAALDEAIDTFVNKQGEEIAKLSGGEIPDKIEAYQRAGRLSAAFPKRAGTTPVKQLLNEMTKDLAFKKELGAKVAYDRAVQQASAAPARRSGLLHTVGTQFKGTHYGDLASSEADGS